MRVSFTIPDECARLLESKCIRIGYPSSRAFLRALTIWTAAKMGEQSPAVMTEYAEEVRTMFAELTDSEAPAYGAPPRRHKRKKGLEG